VGVVATVVLTLPWGLGGAIIAYALTQATVALATLLVSRRSARATPTRIVLP
jgi:O-antigen/teichoic acid export membrane protein